MWSFISMTIDLSVGGLEVFLLDFKKLQFETKPFHNV
jgi:hypothetical protein